MASTESTQETLNGAKEASKQRVLAATKPVFKYMRSFTVLLVLFILFAYIIFPTYWLISNGFKPLNELFQIPPTLFPHDLTLEHINRLFATTPYMQYLKSSLIVGISATIVTTVLATLAAYGLTRSSLGAGTKRFLAASVLFIYMFPKIMLGVPIYAIAYRFGLLNSYFALMIAHVAITLPFALWILWQYFQTIHMRYEEAAWLSGASRLRGLREIVLPMALPGIIAVVIFAFAFSWNDFTFAIILMSDEAAKTIPVGMDGWVEDKSGAIGWGVILAGSVVALIPSLLIIFFGQKYFLKGATI
jgi:multiple sugar transport system permease protein